MNSQWLAVALGDFNQVLYAKDKFSFTNLELRVAMNIQECSSACNLCELPSHGNYYTWNNNKNGEDVVWERLDRIFANSQWINNHEMAYLLNLPVLESDHGPIMLSTSKNFTKLKGPTGLKLCGLQIFNVKEW